MQQMINKLMKNNPVEHRAEGDAEQLEQVEEVIDDADLHAANDQQELMKNPLSTVLKEMQISSNKLKRLLMMQISMQQMINKLMKNSLLSTVLKEMQNSSNKLKRLLMMQISMQQMINRSV
jgi:glutamate 5-kinase